MYENIIPSSAEDTKIEIQENDEKDEITEDVIIENTEPEETQNIEEIPNTENEIWQVEIPAIDLVAPISEGTTQEVMEEYVGHFEETNLWNGNIGLAAHNRRISNKLF